MKNLILLHGALGAASQMHELQTALETHFNVYILEFDGHGNKAASLDALDIKHMALELDRFITQHAISDPIVFGYSMGGYVALYHASKLPNKIAKVITLATKFDWNPESSEKESRMLNPEQMEIQIPAFCDLLYQRHGSSWKRLVNNTAEMMLRLGKNQELPDAELKKIRIPVLICLGDKDKMVSVSETNHAVSNLGNGNLQILPDTPHPLERVNCDLLAELIIKFAN